MSVETLNDAINQYKLMGGMQKAHSLEGLNDRNMNEAVVAALKTGVSEAGYNQNFLNQRQDPDLSLIASTGQGALFRFYVNESGVLAGSSDETTAAGNADQSTVTITPASGEVPAGIPITFLAQGGNSKGAYVWGGEASGEGTRQVITFGELGPKTITVYRSWDSSHKNSNVATATVTVVVADQNVTISPSSKTVELDEPVTFTTRGGAGEGAYIWGGAAYGNGDSQTLSFPQIGSYVVTVYHEGDRLHNLSNTATSTITVTSKSQGPVSITPSATSIEAGETVDFTATGGTGSGAYVWGGAASGTGNSASVDFSSAGTQTVTVYRAGDDDYAASAVATATIFVSRGTQTAVSISPNPASVGVGQAITLTASGGAGDGEYVWGGSVSGTGTSISPSFDQMGERTITVYRRGNDSFTDSETATATVTVSRRTQSAVSLTPADTTLNLDESVMLSASGGSGTGEYRWSGALYGTGLTEQFFGDTGGSYTVTVYRAGDDIYLDSAPVTASITVLAQVAVTPTLTISAPAVTYGNASTITVRVGDIPSGALDGQTLTLALNGNTYTSTIASDTATFLSPASLGAGSYMLSASTPAYTPTSGQYRYNEASTIGALTVNRMSISPTLTVSAPAVSYGTAATLTVTVGNITSGALSGRTVSATINGQEYSATIRGNTATITGPSTLAVGNHTVGVSLAAYTPSSGNYNYNAAFSSASLAVNRATVTPTLMISAPDTTYKSSPTITITVGNIASGALAGRTITTTINSKSYSATISGNTASFTGPSNLSIGTYPVSATLAAYTPGSGNYNYTAASGSGTLNIVGYDQSSVSIRASATTLAVGSYLTVTAQGGTTGEWYWGGDISGTGWSQTFVVNRTGTWTITVYRAANGYYAQSETASITISVTKGPQAQVTIIPTTWYTTVGNSITFTATGGSGTGVYQWGGDASGTGTSVSVRFLSAGTHTVTCYRHGDSNYFDSNTASLGVSIGQ
jgi:hypothetical protein